MEMIATLALKPDMVIAQDVLSQDKVIVKKDTVVDRIVINKLEAFHIMGVSIKEPEDFANTYYEKIRVSKNFKLYEQTYFANLTAYKVAVDSFLYKKVPFHTGDLLKISETLFPEKMTGKLLLSYLYNLVPTEDNLTYAHALNVALIAKVFGGWLRMSKEDIDTLVLCGFLFDIGKFMLPYDIIWKPDRLNKMEFDLVKTHAFHGYHLLRNQNMNENIKLATLHHHERCDGSGYPQGLTTSEISPFAKIISIIDVYEAMTSARSYREPMSPFKVISIFESEGFQKYEVRFIMTFLEHLVDEHLGNRVLLSNGMEGEVVLINKNAFSRPIIKCADSIVDLSKNRDIYITAVI